MSTRAFTLDELEDLEVSGGKNTTTVPYSEHVDSGRWYEYHDVVFKADDGKLYYAAVQHGLTEYQECYGEESYPSMVNGNLECPEVELYEEETPVMRWRKVATPDA